MQNNRLTVTRGAGERKVMYIGLHMVIIKFHQVLIENDIELDINAKLGLESQNKNQK